MEDQPQTEGLKKFMHEYEQEGLISQRIRQTLLFESSLPANKECSECVLHCKVYTFE